MSRVVLVTGCSTGGIGYALSEEFAEQGCVVYATSRRVETIADFSDSNIKKLALDVTSDEEVQNVIQEIIRNEGKIDVVVNNAGVISPGPLIDHTSNETKKFFDVNAFSVLRVSRAVIPEMAKRKQGLIVNIGSIVGEIPTPWNGLYCAAKAAVYSMSEVLSMECRPFGIKVLHVAPGAVKSNISKSGAEVYSLPDNSLYQSYLPNIIVRIWASQGLGSMPTRAFARGVVSKALQKEPPLYMLSGGNSFLFAILKWLPRALVLKYMWGRFSKKM